MIVETRQYWTPVLALICALASCSSDRRGKVAFPQLGRDYYVNNRQAYCRDAGSGTEDEPFCTFRPINEISSSAGFGPGDRIFLARGATWNEPLEVKAAGKGSAERPSIIGAYGEGPRPKIILHGLINEKCLLAINHDPCEIQYLEPGHTSPSVDHP